MPLKLIVGSGFTCQIHFHVLLSGTPKESVGDDSLAEDGVGEMEIERIPTRVVEVRRKDLVPVIERLQNFTKVQGARYCSQNSCLTYACSVTYGFYLL